MRYKWELGDSLSQVARVIVQGNKAYGTHSSVIKFRVDEAVDVLRGMIWRTGKDVEFIVTVYVLLVRW